MTADLLTAAEAADLLRFSAAKLRRLANAGKVPHIELPGGDIRFDAAELRDWIDQHRRPANGTGEAAAR